MSLRNGVFNTSLPIVTTSRLWAKSRAPKGGSVYTLYHIWADQCGCVGVHNDEIQI